MGKVAAHNQRLVYGSVCSGIEAASVAWHPLGWRPSRLPQIFHGATKEIVVVKCSAKQITSMTKNAAHFPGFMVMVNTGLNTFDIPPTNRTLKGLRFEKRCVIFWFYAVAVHKIMLPSHFRWFRRACLLPGMPPEPPRWLPMEFINNLLSPARRTRFLGTHTVIVPQKEVRKCAI